MPARSQCPALARGVFFCAGLRVVVTRPWAGGARIPAALTLRVGATVYRFEFFFFFLDAASPRVRCGRCWRGARPQFLTSSSDEGRGKVVGVRLLTGIPGRRAGTAVGMEKGSSPAGRYGTEATSKREAGEGRQGHRDLDPRPPRHPYGPSRR